MKIFLKIRPSALLFAILLIILMPLRVFAYDVDFFSANDILFYNPDDSNCGPSTTSLSTGKNTGKWQTQLSEPFSFEDYVVEVLRNVAKKMDVSEDDVVTEEHVIALVAFGWGEGGNLMNKWTYNVFNTGYHGDGVELSTEAKNNGTQGYATFNDGVEATARTMTGKNQSRLAATLIKKDSTAKEFMYALTYFKEFEGNKLWAEASTANPAGYYQERLNLISTVKKKYKDIASTKLGPPGNNYRNNLHVSEDKLRYSFSEDSSSAVESGDSTSSDCSSTGGGVGTANGFTFPLQTTQKIVKDGIDGSSWCWSQTNNCHHDYKAIDVFVETGTPILASKAGQVVGVTTKTCTSRDTGCNVQIMGEDNVLYYYTHMSEIPVVKKGQSVKAGDKIGEVGTNQTAMGTTRHLHMDMLPGDEYSGRVQCAGAACSGYPFINAQEYAFNAFNNLPKE